MQQSMFIYSADWQGSKTFKMLPIDLKCPFNEVIYDPNTKVLAIISKEHKDKPHMFPKLDSRGKVVLLKKNKSLKEEQDSIIEERVMMDTYYEYYIESPEDIKEFVNFFANNNKHSALKILE